MRWLLTINKKNMVNIDTVYQRVLAIANKEQRGYITPQEFNLYANQAQMDIFEQYFYDLNALNRVPGNDYTYADQVDIIQEKIDIFERYRQDVVMSGDSAEPGMGTLPLYYRMGELYYKCKGGYVEIEKISQNQIHHIQNSPLTAPSLTRPVYVRTSGVVPEDGAAGGDPQNSTFENEIAQSRSIQIYPTTIIKNVVCNYIARPATVRWTYIVNSSNSRAMFDGSHADLQHFELHMSEETELVVKILELAGIEIKDPQLYQIAAQEEAQNVQQENK
tara:strand:- start:6384 stop:7211 length:828 start_codon:yes stop_codon:yes gene_type:complete